MKAEVLCLPGPGAAAFLVQHHVEGFQAVIAVGGDGTVNEVAAGLAEHAPEVPLGILPLGLSNCLARHFRLPRDIGRAALVVSEGRTAPLPLALASGRVVTSFLGAGFDAEIVHRVAARRKGAIRNWNYVRAGLEPALKAPPALRAAVDGRAVEGSWFQAILISINNYARFFPGGRSGGIPGHPVSPCRRLVPAPGVMPGGGRPSGPGTGRRSMPPCPFLAPVVE
jgi:diacylglycerol kinase (ATP)